MELTQVIIAPYLTEKSYAARGEENKKYAFLVDMKATKNDILLAFQSIFDMEPVKITTQIRKPSATRTGTLHPGYKKAKKIAYITLAKGQDISISQADFEAKENPSDENLSLIEKDSSTIANAPVKEALLSELDKQPIKVESKKEAWKKTTTKNY